MKSVLSTIVASTLLAAIAMAQPKYTVTDLGGGTFGYASIITDAGLVAGHAAAPDGTWNATLWQTFIGQNGGMTNLNVPGLGGQNSEAFGVNLLGEVSGEAETSTPDPHGEDFCGFKALGLPSNGNTCRAFVWQFGRITALPTLPGAANASGSQINNLGEVAGYAENSTKDANCGAPQLFETKPVVWQKGEIRELPTVAGDVEGVALALNDYGQVVGGSGYCSAFNADSQFYVAPIHALLWQPDGKVTDLGNLGGPAGTFGGNVASGINNQGQVVGNSDLPGDTTSHAFLWQNGVMKDLGVFGSDIASFALGINDRSEVVGIDLTESFGNRAVLWENGDAIDLNALIPPNSGLYLQLAEGINSFGQIVGFASVTSGPNAGEIHAFLATPVTGEPGGGYVSDAATASLVQRANARQLRRRP